MLRESGRRLTALLVAIVALALGAAPAAQAAFNMNLTGAAPTNTAVGAHSDVVVQMTFSAANGNEKVRDLEIDLPAGLLGDPNAVNAVCTRTQFNSDNCPSASRVGKVETEVDTAIPLVELTVGGDVYLITPNAGEPARMGIWLRPSIGNNIKLESGVRLRAPGDYGLTSVINGIPTEATGIPLFGSVGITVTSMKLTLYGTPPSNPKGPFLTNPTDCVPATFVVRATSYGNQTLQRNRSFTPTGCDGGGGGTNLVFDPALSVSPTTNVPADQPTAFSVTIGWGTTPAGKVQAHLKKATVTLPVGMALSPGIAADGLAGCTDAQFAADSDSAPSCPAASKIGTVNFVTPLLADPLTGDVYLGQPNATDKMRLLVHAAGSGVTVKLMGRVTPDEDTGQVVAVFDNLPKVPFNTFTLSFRGGDNAVLKAPPGCASHTTTATLEAWSTAVSTAVRNAQFSTGNCATDPFNPNLATSFSTQAAGADLDMSLTFTRTDRQPLIDTIEASLPTGLLGRLKDIPQCAVAQAQTGNCPANTRVGSVTTVVGTGNAPITLDGQIYLTGPVDGGVAGLAFVVPAQVGPIDLGNVVTLAALKVRADLGIDVVATLPRIIGGVPLAIRSLQLEIDRDGFLFNASSCEAKSLSVKIKDRNNASVTRTAGYQVTGCDQLPFTPTLDVAPKSQQAGMPTALTVTIGFPSGQQQANLRSAEVTLPEGTALSPTVAVGGLEACSDAQFGQGSLTTPSCPAKSKLGTVLMETPLLDDLTGDVYLGQPTAQHKFRVFLYATIDSVKVKLAGTVTPDEESGQLTARFDNLPEVPFTSFVLTFRGGNDAVLRAPRACGSHTAQARLVSHAQPGSHATRTSSFTTVDCDKDPFQPTLAASVDPTTAATNTALSMTISRGDKQPWLRDMSVSLPTGLLAHINEVPACPVNAARSAACPANTKVGTVTVRVGSGATPLALPGDIHFTEPLDGGVGGLAFVVPAEVGPIDLGEVVTLAALKVRPDLGVDVVVEELPRIVGGVPLAIRSLQLDIDRDGFMFNASSCEQKQITATFTGEGDATHADSAGYQATGCGGAPFNPSIDVTPKQQDADRPTALGVKIAFPGGQQQATLAAAEVTLPEGMTLSPGVATGGLDGCSDAQFQIDSTADPACPTKSKLGTVRLETPLLGELVGDAYLATQTPQHRFRVFLYAEKDPVKVKLVGVVEPNESTGRVTARFDNLPEVPFSEFELSFRGGDDAVLKAPAGCATHLVNAKLTPHGAPGSPVTRNSSFQTSDCATEPFNPTLSAGFSNNKAGADVAMSLTFARGERQPLIDTVNVSLPTGLLGRLTGMPRCAVAQAAAGDCPANTRVGTITAVTGTGNAPLSLDGPVYLTDPVDGGVAGLAFVVPAKVGPIDLGNVVTLAALKVRSDLGIDVVARELPRIVGGVPLAIRSLKIDIDRDGFMFNASSCEAKKITTVVKDRNGTTRTPDADYQATDCDKMPFSPTLDVGPKSQPAGKPTSLTVTIGFPTPGQSNLRSAEVTLPVGTALSPTVASDGLEACSDAQFAVGSQAEPNCPAKSKLGTVRLENPLIDDLTGEAYLGQPTAQDRFRLFLYASFESVMVKLTGVVTPDEETGQLTTKFDNLPEVPFTNFILTFRGGSDAVLTAPRSCGPHTASARLVPHARPDTTATPSSTFTTVSCAKAAFTPSLSATVSPTKAAADTHMSITIARGDDEPLLRGMTVSLPKGLLAHIDKVPACPVNAAQSASCPANTKVGEVTVRVGGGSSPLELPGSVYFTDKFDDAVGGLAFVVPAEVGPIDLGDVVTIAALKVRSDLGVDVVVDELPRIVGGVPLEIRSLKIDIDRDGFMFNASSCEAKTITGAFRGEGGATHTDSTGYQATDCGGAPFTPSIDVTPKQQNANLPTGLTVKIAYPSGQQQATLSSAQVTLPEGMTLSPGVAAKGLDGCSDAQFQINSTADPACPAKSQLGTVRLETALLGTLTGGVYLGTQTQQSPFRIFIYAEKDPVKVKLAGVVTPDPQTGRLTTTFTDLPDVPFSELLLTFRDGDDAVLKAPSDCRTHTVHSRLVPHGAPSTSVTPTSDFTTSNCRDAAFAPSLSATPAPAQAAAHTRLSLSVERGDDQPLLDAMSFALPPGLLGSLAAVPSCPVDAARAGRCPESSRVGTVTAVTGTGNAPLSLDGGIYLTAGFDGGIAGLAVVVPARVGPINLGDVVVLAKLTLRGDLGIDVAVPGMPRIVGGVPLAIRALHMRLDRDGFMVNASSCQATAIRAEFAAQNGARASASAPYHPVGCEGVPFAPRLGAAIGGSVDNPSMLLTIESPAGHAPLAGAQITLPAQVGADLAAMSKMCEYEAYLAGNCPAVSRVGTAEATSPLIPTPLSGPVTLIRAPGRTLPSLAIDLKGITHIRLRADNEAAGGRLRSTVTGIPGVPLSRFTLQLDSGGLLKSDRQMMCTGTPQVDATFTSHTGATTRTSATATTPCAQTAGLSDVKIDATLTGARKGRKPVLRVRARGSRLRSLRVTMPKQLRINRKQIRKRGVVRHNGKAVSRKTKKGRNALRIKGKTVTGWTTYKAGVSSLELRLRKGALKRGKGLKPGKRITLKVRVSDSAGRTRSLTVRIKARK